MAALDGIQNKIRPGDPLDKDIYDLQPEELANVPTTPRSLEASLDALRADHDFLLRGDVFTPDVIDTWIWYKQTHEVEALRVRPHPYEFALYYDVVKRSAAVHRCLVELDGSGPLAGPELGCRDRRLGGRSRAGGPGASGSTAPATSMLSAKLKIAQSKPIGSTWKWTKSRTWPKHQAVVAVAQGPGHDQAEGDGQPAVGGRAADEEPVADRHRGDDRQPGEDQAAVGHVPAEAPEGARVVAGLELQDVRDRRERGAGPRRADPWRRRSALVARSNAGPAQGDRPEEDPTAPAARDPSASSAALQLPGALDAVRACRAGPGAEAWRSARRIPGSGRMCRRRSGRGPRGPARGSPARSRSGRG